VECLPFSAPTRIPASTCINCWVIHSSIESNGSASPTNCNNKDLNTALRSHLAIISLRSDLVCHLIITECAMASFLNEIANVILYECSH